MNNTLKREGINILKITVGCFIYALSVVLFIDPIHIIPGSVTGIAVVVKALTGFPIGVLNLIINIPLVIVGTFILGKKLLVYTGLTVFLTSFMMDSLAFLPAMTGDSMLASIFGGVVMGIGLGMILDAGGTTGGTTVVGRLILHRSPGIPMGNILMAGDFIIVVIGALLLRDWDLLLLSLVNLYVCVVAINMVMYGFGKKSISLIQTASAHKLADSVAALSSCRILKKEPSQLLIISLKNDVSKIQRIAQDIDPSSACASFEADHSFGDLFNNVHKN